MEKSAYSAVCVIVCITLTRTREGKAESYLWRNWRRWRQEWWRTKLPSPEKWAPRSSSCPEGSEQDSIQAATQHLKCVHDFHSDGFPPKMNRKAGKSRLLCWFVFKPPALSGTSETGEQVDASAHKKQKHKGVNKTASKQDSPNTRLKSIFQHGINW